jgi:hypothetical protein
MENAAPQSVDRPDHQDIEPSPGRVLEHRVECGSLIPAFRATDPLILTRRWFSVFWWSRLTRR